MPVLLSLETSTDVCSVAIHDDKGLRAVAEVHMGQMHASKLAPLVREVTKMADVTMEMLSGVAVSAGPGSYTGLRIGVSTAKGLCYSLGVPLLSCGTLDVMAGQMKDVVSGDALLCPMIDARRMEVYCALYNRDGFRMTEVEAKIIDEHSFQEQLAAGRVVFAGNGSAKCRPVINHFRAEFLDSVFPSARHLGALAMQKLANGQTEDLIHFEPFYLKDFKAKLPSNKFIAGVNKPA